MKSFFAMQRKIVSGTFIFCALFSSQTESAFGQSQQLCPVGKNQDTTSITEPTTPVRYRASERASYSGLKPKQFTAIVFHDPGSATCDPLAMIRYGVTYDKSREGMFGYHFYIAQDGTVFQGAPLTKRTNHVSGAYRRTTLRYDNSSAIGISLMCGHKKIPAAQLRAAVQLAHTLQVAYAIPSGRIFGHGELQYNRMPNEGLIAARAARTTAPRVVSSFLFDRDKKLTQCVVDGPAPAPCASDCEVFARQDDIRSIPGLPESFYRILSGNTGYELSRGNTYGKIKIPLPKTRYPETLTSITGSQMQGDARAWGYGETASSQQTGTQSQVIFGNPLNTEKNKKR